MLTETFHSFVRSEDGAVTVDWVVMTAAVIAMALGIFSILTTQLPAKMDSVMTEATNRSGL